MFTKKVNFYALAFCALCSLCFAQSASDFIVIDQFGYRLNSQKIAVIRNPLRGVDARAQKSFAPGSNYNVINEQTNQSVFTGAPVHKFDLDSMSGDEIWWFDFSSVNTPGRYHILDVSNNARSFSFLVADNVYSEVLKRAARMFFYQRAGFKKEARYAGAGWADEASHLGALQDSECRLYSDKNNAATERDLRGGWYDAGDYNKYTAWTARYIEDMLNAYREAPEAFADNYDIPESNNGIPDIIDEAKWGMDHLLRLRNADGSMISVVGLSEASPPSAATGQSLYGSPNTTATLGAARAFALGAIVFEQWHTVYADTLKASALRSWTWAQTYPDSMFNNNSEADGTKGLAAGNQEINKVDDDKNGTGARLENQLAAALYMYELTGEKSYLLSFEKNYENFPLFKWGNFMDHYRQAQHLLFFRYMDIQDANPQVVSQLKTAMITAFNKSNDFAGKLGKDGYRSFMQDYPWGSNRAKADYGLMFYLWAQKAMEPAKSAEFEKAAEDYIHYIHGVNPFNTVYLTNMNDYGASKSLTSIYHSWFKEGSQKWSKVGVSEYGPAPGYLPGGPNKNYELDGCCPSGCGSSENNARCNLVSLPPKNDPQAKMYVDINHTWPINTWEISEPSGGYQMPYIRLLSKFVSQGGASSIYNGGKQTFAQSAHSVSAHVRRGVMELRLNGTDAQTVELFNLRGSKIAVLNGKKLSAGNHRFSTKGLAKQMYLVRITSIDKKVSMLSVRVN